MFRKRLRRKWQGFEALVVREVKPKSGAFDLNLAVVGLPPFKEKSRQARAVRQAWFEVSGGGRLHVGRPQGTGSPGAVGSYVGKYLTKHAHRVMAKGFRRWSRTHGFAPDVRMGADREPSGLAHTWLGWVDPGLELTPTGVRWYPPELVS
jgi:hypothetical protein